MFRKILFTISVPFSVFFLIKLLSFSDVIVTPSGQTPASEIVYGVQSPYIPEQMNFAGEEVPIHNFDIRERFDRELMVNMYWQSQTLQFFKRAARFFPVIEPILAEEGIPDDFKYLALIESGLMNVVSPAGAAGFWQILQTTGRELGLEVTTEIDERYHVEKSTRAAAKFLRDAHRSFSSWTSAAAAYNMGRAGLNRQISSQKMDSYYNLWLNEETSRYVFRILAIKTIFENPATYGFYVKPEDLYQPHDYFTVSIDTSVKDWVDFAHQHHITYKELRTLNPWIRQPELNNRNRKTYEIKIPRESLFAWKAPVASEAPETGEEPVNPDM